MGEIINGKRIAKDLRREIKKDVLELKNKDIFPKLTVILAGNNSASEVYVRNKKRAAKKIGIEGIVEAYPADVEEEKILERIRHLNSDRSNHGILVQLPLPEHINEERVLKAIDPAKDVDGFHPVNIGGLLLNHPCLKPCTPSGIIHLIKSTEMEIKGSHAVIIGRSNIVGKPVSFMLLNEDATVTICHSKTIDLPEKVGEADIVVAAVGKAEFVKGTWIKDGAVVIDVGINRTEEGKLVGDVEFEKAIDRASFITPVPGGVGPMTIAMLMKNTVMVADKIGRQ